MGGGLRDTGPFRRVLVATTLLFRACLGYPVQPKTPHSRPYTRNGYITARDRRQLTTGSMRVSLDDYTSPAAALY